MHNSNRSGQYKSLLPDNFIRNVNGWGVCPECGRKIMKLANTTVIVNFPAYCKSCKREVVVSWWDAENVATYKMDV